MFRKRCSSWIFSVWLTLTHPREVAYTRHWTRSSLVQIIKVTAFRRKAIICTNYGLLINHTPRKILQMCTYGSWLISSAILWLVYLSIYPPLSYMTMCFLLMTLVPVQKRCVNIYVYIYVYIPYTSSVIGRIYNGSVIQYWRSCTPSRSIGECAVPDLNTILCFLWFTNCVLLFDNNLILGCLWHCVLV